MFYIHAVIYRMSSRWFDGCHHRVWYPKALSYTVFIIFCVRSLHAITLAQCWPGKILSVGSWRGATGGGAQSRCASFATLLEHGIVCLFFLIPCLDSGGQAISSKHVVYGSESKDFRVDVFMGIVLTVHRPWRSCPIDLWRKENMIPYGICSF